MGFDAIKTREFSPEDTDVAQRIAAQIGLALQRKHAALELHAAKEYAEQLFHAAPSAVITVDPKGIITGCNQKAVELVGYGADELVGQSCLKFALTPCSQSCGLFDERVPKPIRGAECQLQTSDGRVLTVVKSAVLLKDANGQIVGGIESFEDITEQKNTETRLVHSLSLLESTLEATADGILVVDREGNIILHNRRFLEMWHIPDDLIADLKDKTLLSFVQEQLIQPDRFVDEIRELYTQPTAESLDVLTFKDGRIFERLSRPQRIGDEIVGRVWSFHDVTAQRLAEQSLRLTQFSIDKVPQAVFWLGREGHILNANEGASRMLGHSREELLEMTVFDYNPCVSREEFDFLWQKLQEQRSLVMESEHVTKLGRRYPVEVHLSILEYQGKEYVFSFGSEVTDRKALETKQQEQLKQEALLHQVAVARVTPSDLNTKLGTICEKTAAYYQADHAAFAFLDERGMYADVIFEYKDPSLKDSARVASIVNIAPLTDLFSLRTAVALVDVHQASLLESIWDILGEFDNLSTFLIPILLNGQPVGMMEFNWLKPICLDERKSKIGKTIADQISQIIQQHRAEIALHEQRSFAQQVTENMGQGLVVVRNDWIIEYANPAFASLLGYSLTDLLERSILDIVYKADPQVVKEIAAGWQKGEIQEREIVFKHLSGKPIFALMSGVPRWHNGQIDGAIVVMTDLSSRKKIEKEQAHARDQALEASRLKSEFLANMSHEIRTPLNAVIGMTSLLMGTPLDDEQRDYAETIRSSGDVLLSLINDILDFSKIEAGKLELEKQPIDLRDCVEEALDVVVAKAAEKGLELAYIMEEQVPQAFIGDVTRLRQILVNLLNNAIKFTEKGEVVLRVASDWEDNYREEGRPLLLKFSVQDTGIGIPEEKMNRLFQSFSQVDASTTRRFGGSGLGLAICKRLVELMGGRIWVESEIDKGATFYFTVQVQPTSLYRRSHLRSAQPLLSGKRLLIVDDNETNRFILIQQTASWGMQPAAAASAQEALEMIQSGEHFDAAVLDMQMPQMDGLTLAKEIYRLCGKKTFPLLMLSSLGDKEGLREENLFAAYLTKPVKPKRLLVALRSLFDKTVLPLQSVYQREIDAEMGRQHPLRILLAEDNVVNQKVTLRILERMGYRADVAANGLEVIESLQRQPYDVVLMDVQMPNMDGVEATQQIREIWSVDRQPTIIAMTANALTGDREKYLAAGMDHYISKPVRIQELLNALGLVKPLARS